MITSHLVVRSSTLRELEVDTLAGEALVDLRVGIQPVVDTTTLLLVQNDLENLAAVFTGPETLADDLDGIDEVGKDGIMNSSEGSGTRALLRLICAGSVGALGTGQNTAGSNDKDMAIGELLLELTSEADRISIK
jgi:hypothetical protein